MKRGSRKVTGTFLSVQSLPQHTTPNTYTTFTHWILTLNTDYWTLKQHRWIITQYWILNHWNQQYGGVQSFGGAALKHLLHHCRSPAYQDRLAETRRVSSRAPVWGCSWIIQHSQRTPSAMWENIIWLTLFYQLIITLFICPIWWYTVHSTASITSMIHHCLAPNRILK